MKFIEPGKIVLAAGLGVILVGLNVAQFRLMGVAFDSILDSAAIGAAWVAIAVGAVILVRAAVAGAARISVSKIATETRSRVRNDLLAHMERMGPVGMSDQRTGEVAYLAGEGVDALELLYGLYLPQFIVGLAAPVAVSAYIMSVDLVTGVVLLAVVPLIPVLIMLVQRRFRTASKEYFSTASELSESFLEGLQGLATLRVFDRARYYGEALSARASRLRRKTMSLLKLNQLVILVVDLSFSLAVTSLAAILAFSRLQAGHITAGTALFVVLASIELVRPMNLLGAFFFAGAIGRRAKKRINAFLSIPPHVSLQVSVAQPASVSNMVPGEAVSGGDIRFSGVSFSYGETPVLDGLDLFIPEASRVALVGESGSGKSTLLSLLLRFIEPHTGTVCIGDRNVRDMSREEISRTVTYVPQRVHVFTESLRENLCMGLPFDEKRLSDALASARLSDWVRTLPDGLDTILGERGGTVSGGQAQRIGIARAFLRDAPVLVLDEPTAQLDPETEGEVLEALRLLATNRTVLMVTHRATTFALADDVLVLDAGAIQERTPA